MGSDTCAGGLHIINITTPTNPLFAGCHSTARTHDTQCVIYQGPDADYPNNPEICVSSNEDHIEIGNLANSELTEIAFFDTFPFSGADEFSGAWSVYPYFPSGTIIVSDRTYGLFILSIP